MKTTFTIDGLPVEEYLQACYEIGLLTYPTYSAIGAEGTLEQTMWKMGWDDAKDLADCKHFDHRPQMRAMGMTI